MRLLIRFCLSLAATLSLTSLFATPPLYAQSGSLIINEFRFRGSAGASDEFIEFYNPANAPVTVTTSDGSAGWALVALAASGLSATTRFTIPNGTVIPARGYYLAAHSTGYSLSLHPAGPSATASPDITYAVGVSDNVGIALFKTATAANFNLSNRLDAVGFGELTGTLPDLYREGTGLLPAGGITSAGEYSFVRKPASSGNGRPKDTNDNTADFHFVATTGGTFSGQQSILGAPSPQNSSSGLIRNSSLGITETRLDPTVPDTSLPNRYRNKFEDYSAAFPTLAAEAPSNVNGVGTFSLRRKYTNNTGQPVTALRFRIIDITTKGNRLATESDMRAISSVFLQDVTTGGLAVQGLTLEQPPTQASGGGLNSTLTAGTITLATPLSATAPNNTINVNFKFAVKASGAFRLFINFEAVLAP